MLKWTSRPPFISNNFDENSWSQIMPVMASDHATNLLSWRETRRRFQSKSHPKIILISLAPASAKSLFKAAISSRGMGSEACFGQAAV